jgi:hypothetical protein
MERTRLEHLLKQARDTLGDTASDAAWTAGRDLSLPGALTLVATLINAA